MREEGGGCLKDLKVERKERSDLSWRLKLMQSGLLAGPKGSRVGLRMRERQRKCCLHDSKA